MIQLLLSSAKVSVGILLFLTLQQQQSGVVATPSSSLLRRALQSSSSSTNSKCMALSEGFTHQLDINEGEPCIVLPGTALEGYRVILSSSSSSPSKPPQEEDSSSISFLYEYYEAPSSAVQDGIKYTNLGTGSIQDGWDPTIERGIHFCAQGGSTLTFDNKSNGNNEINEITVQVQRVPNDQQDCCVRQPISWENNHLKCPTTLTSSSSSICLSTSRYFMKADSLEYRVVRDDDQSDVVVLWENKSTHNQCSSIRNSDGIPSMQVDKDNDEQMVQTVRVDFVTEGNLNADRCLFLDIATTTQGFWYVRRAGVCGGNASSREEDGLEYFTKQEVNIGGIEQNCYSQTGSFTIQNSRGSTITFTNLSLEVLLPWSDASIMCETEALLPTSRWSDTTTEEKEDEDATVATTTTTTTAANTSNVEEDDATLEEQDSSESPNGGGISSQNAAILAIVLFILLIVGLNCYVIFRICRRNHDVAESEPKGTHTVMSDMPDGRVMKKTTTLLPDGTSIVEKTMYPDEETAAKSLVSGSSSRVRR